MMVNRKDEQFEKMYEEYCKEFSLEQVGKMFGITRQSVYSGFKIRSYELRKKNILPYQFFNGKKYTLRNTGYYTNTLGRRNLMHRDVWEFNNGEIPEFHDIHHIDFDKSNNKISNLELIRKDEHARRDSIGSNQYIKKIRGEC